MIMGETDTLHRLTARQSRFLVALLESSTVREAARLAGVSETTAWRYLADSGVKRELAQRTDGLITQTSAGVCADMAEARGALVAVMRDPEAPCSARVTAARAILDAGMRLYELMTLAGRVSAIERAVFGELVEAEPEGAE